MILRIVSWVCFVAGMGMILFNGRDVTWLRAGWTLAALGWVLQWLPGSRRNALYSELERIGKLKDAGTLSEEEYQLVRTNVFQASGLDPGATYPDSLKSLVTLWSRGFRAGDWPLDKVGDALMDTKEDWQVPYARLMAYYAYLDRAQFDAAHVHIAESYARVSEQPWQAPSFISLISLELAFSRGFLGLELDEATAAIDKIQNPDETLLAVYHRARAAVFAAQRKHQEAEAAANEGREVLKARGAIIQPNVQAELDWIDWIFQARPSPSGL